MRTHQPPIPVLCLLLTSILCLLSSCATGDKAPAGQIAEPVARSTQSNSVFATTLPALLECLATHRDDWNYDKIAEICAIGRFDSQSSWETKWDKRDTAPFISGAIFKSHALGQPGQPLLPSGCYLRVNPSHPLGLALYAQLTGIIKSRLDESLSRNDGRFADSRQKNLGLHAEIEKGHVISIIVSYEN